MKIFGNIICFFLIVYFPPAYSERSAEPLVEVQGATFADIMLLSNHSDIRHLVLILDYLDPSKSEGNGLVINLIDRKLVDINLYFNNITSEEIRSSVCHTPDLFENNNEYCPKNPGESLCEQLAVLKKLCLG